MLYRRSCRSYCAASLRAGVVVCLMAALAAPIQAKPPKVGDKIETIKGTDLEGKEYSFDPKNAKHPVVLVFLRGYPGYQCPLCTRQVGALVAKQKEFEKLGAEVVLVYPGPAKDLTQRAKEFDGSKDLPQSFHLLVDGDYKLVNQFDLRWNAPRETAYPSTFVIDSEGKVVYNKISLTHGDRSETEDVLKALR